MPKGETGRNDRSVAWNVPCNPRQASSIRDVRACKLLRIYQDHQETWSCHRLCHAEEIYAKEGERGPLFKFYSVRRKERESLVASETRCESWKTNTSFSQSASPIWRRSLPSRETTKWRKWTIHWWKSTGKPKLARSIHTFTHILVCLFLSHIYWFVCFFHQYIDLFVSFTHIDLLVSFTHIGLFVSFAHILVCLFLSHKQRINPGRLIEDLSFVLLLALLFRVSSLGGFVRDDRGSLWFGGLGSLLGGLEITHEYDEYVLFGRRSLLRLFHILMDYTLRNSTSPTL